MDVIRFNVLSVDFEKAELGEKIHIEKPQTEKWLGVKSGDICYITKGYPNLFDSKRIRKGKIVEVQKIANGLRFVVEKSIV